MAITAEQLAAAPRGGGGTSTSGSSAVPIRIGRPGTRTTSSSSCTSRAGSVSTPRTCASSRPHAYMTTGHEEADVLRQAKATLAKVRAT